MATATTPSKDSLRTAGGHKIETRSQPPTPAKYRFGIRTDTGARLLSLGPRRIHTFWVTKDNLFWISDFETHTVPIDTLTEVSSHWAGRSHIFHFTDGTVRVSVPPAIWEPFAATLKRLHSSIRIVPTPRLHPTNSNRTNGYSYYEENLTTREPPTIS